MHLTNRNEIIMVDDNEIDTQFVKRCLEKSELNNKFLAFDDGYAFIAYMESIRAQPAKFPALILLDINMPRLTGFEVYEKLRNIKEYTQIPIVMFLSNSDSPVDYQQSEKMNVNMQEKFYKSADCVNFFNQFAAC